MDDAKGKKRGRPERFPGFKAQAASIALRILTEFRGATHFGRADIFAAFPDVFDPDDVGAAQVKWNYIREEVMNPETWAQIDGFPGLDVYGNRASARFFVRQKTRADAAAFED